MLKVWFSNRRARLRKQMSYANPAGAHPVAGSSSALPLSLPYAGGSGSMNVVNPVAPGATPYTNLSGCGSIGPESAHLYSTPSMYSAALSPSLPASAIHPASSYGTSSMLVSTNPQVMNPFHRIKRIKLTGIF